MSIAMSSEKMPIRFSAATLFAIAFAEAANPFAQIFAMPYFSPRRPFHSFF